MEARASHRTTTRPAAKLEGGRSRPPPRLHELELRADLDPALEATCHGAEASVKAVHTRGHLALALGEPEAVAHVDPLDHEHSVVVYHLANRLDL